jgi:thiamine-monophosphate kinase
VSTVGEFELIAEINARLARRGERVLRTSGDDGAVVRCDGVAVTSVDAFVEGVHFRLTTTSLADLGHKCLAASLSDIAAMGAEAGEAYIVLGLPDHLGAREALELVEGAERLAGECGVTVCGGDLTASGELFVAITVVGHARSESELAGRDGARPGDLVGVTGMLGGAGAGLVLLERKEHGIAIDVGERLLERQRLPRPRLAAGRALASAGVTAMIDLSDGIASDALRIAEASNAALEIELRALPLDDGVEVVADLLGLRGFELAASAGEDYELLVTAASGARVQVQAAAEAAGAPLTWIGTVTDGEGVSLMDEGGAPIPLSGWDHFGRHAQRSARRWQASR